MLSVGTMEDWDAKLPTCRTCHNLLHLPPYSEPAILEQRLNLAMCEESFVLD